MAIYGFDRNGVQKIRATVRRVARMPAPALARRADYREALRDAINIRIADSLAAPQYALGWIKGYDETNRIWQVRRAMYPGISLVCIVCGALGVRASGTAWRRGPEDHPVLVSSYASLAIGDRIGAQQASWYGAADDLGPLTMTAPVPAAEQPAGLPAGVGLVRAEITGRRGDGIYVRNNTGSIHQRVYTVLINSPYDLSFESSGHVKWSN